MFLFSASAFYPGATVSETVLRILRLVLAAVNGIIFAFGVMWLLETLNWRPERWRRRLSRLIAQAEQDEIAGEEDEKRAEEGRAKRVEIEELRRRLLDHRRNPKTLLNAGFALLMIAVALFALSRLLFPSFQPFP